MHATTTMERVRRKCHVELQCGCSCSNVRGETERTFQSQPFGPPKRRIKYTFGCVCSSPDSHSCSSASARSLSLSRSLRVPVDVAIRTNTKKTASRRSRLLPLPPPPIHPLVGSSTGSPVKCQITARRLFAVAVPYTCSQRSGRVTTRRRLP